MEPRAARRKRGRAAEFERAARAAEFGNEEQLYQHVRCIVCKQVRSYGGYPYDYTSITTRAFEGREIHLIGVSQGFRKPMEYAHNVLVPKIKGAPESWLFFLDSGRQPGSPGRGDPASISDFYLSELSGMFGIPVEAAFPELFDKGLRAYVRKETGMCEDEIDRLLFRASGAMMNMESVRLLKEFMGSLSAIARSRSPERIRSHAGRGLELAGQLSTSLQMPLRETTELLLLFDGSLDFREQFGEHWMRYSRERFHSLLKRHKERVNVLVHADLGSIGTFEQ